MGPKTETLVVAITSYIACVGRETIQDNIVIPEKVQNYYINMSRMPIHKYNNGEWHFIFDIGKENISQPFKKSF